MIIAIIFVLLGVIFMIWTLVYTGKKKDLQGIIPVDKANIKKEKRKLSNLWGINGVNNQIVTINNNQHSIIVELDSIEYGLLHDEERISVDNELVSISKMLEFPIQFLEIKKKIDLGDMIDDILSNTMNASPNVKEYANHIIEHLRSLQGDDNLFERNNYMIISSFDSIKKAEIELKEFYNSLRRHLNNAKISTRLLNDEEIIKLIYEQLHKDNKNDVIEIKEKGGLDLYVTGE